MYYRLRCTEPRAGRGESLTLPGKLQKRVMFVRALKRSRNLPSREEEEKEGEEKEKEREGKGKGRKGKEKEY